jgi:hypothetical protein
MVPPASAKTFAAAAATVECLRWQGCLHTSWRRSTHDGHADSPHGRCCDGPGPGSRCHTGPADGRPDGPGAGLYEAGSIADTIHSLYAQTRPPVEIIVIDDCSTDGTADVARALGVRVVTPPGNSGSKAGAQNFALPLVGTEYTMAIDADTSLAPDAIEKLTTAFDDRAVAAACGFVIPRRVRTVWERGRHVEYILCALGMPFHVLYRKLRRPDEPRRWRLAFTQFSIAASILAALSLIGWVLGAFSGPGSSGSDGSNRPVVLGVSALAVTLGVLFTLLVLVEIVRWTVGRSDRTGRAMELRSASRTGR